MGSINFFVREHHPMPGIGTYCDGLGGWTECMDDQASLLNLTSTDDELSKVNHFFELLQNSISARPFQILIKFDIVNNHSISDHLRCSKHEHFYQLDCHMVINISPLQENQGNSGDLVLLMALKKPFIIFALFVL